MTLAYTAVGGSDSGNNGNPSVTAPVVVTAGDILTVVIGWRGSTTTMTPPDGTWTEIAGSPWRNTTSNTEEIRAFWKLALGSEDGATFNFTKTGGGAGQTFLAVCFGFSGSDTNNPYNVVGTASPNVSQANVGPIAGITPTTAGSHIIVVGFRADDISSADTLTGDGLTWNEIVQLASTNGNDAGMAIDRAEGWTSGAITDKTMVFNGGAANTGLGVMFALRPPPPGGGGEETGGGGGGSGYHNRPLPWVFRAIGETPLRYTGPGRPSFLHIGPRRKK